MPLTSAPSVNVSRSPVMRRRGGAPPASVPAPPDTTPDVFAFVDASNVPVSTVSVSNSITVSGVSVPTAISIVGGEYEKNASGSWVTTAGTVVNGDTVKVRGTSSASGGTAVNVTLTIGDVTDTYTIMTVAAPVAPVLTRLSTDPDDELVIQFALTGAQSGDQIVFELDDILSFASVNDTNTVTLDEGAVASNSGTVTLVPPAGLVYARAFLKRGAVLSAASNVVSATITGPAFTFAPLAYYDETSVVSSGGAVSQWTDKGLNAIHLTQATSGNRSAWNSGTGWMSFDGVDDYLISSTRDLSGKPALCAFAKVNVAADSAGGILALGPTGGEDYSGGGGIFWYSSAPNVLSLFRGSGLALAVTSGVDVRVGTVLNTSGNEVIYNKEAATSASSETYNIVFGSSVQFVLGARWNSSQGYPGSFGKFSIRRLLLTDFVPSAPQLDEIWAWLGA